MEEIISKAIKNKNLLEFIYKEKRRIVEPHTLGINLKNTELLSAFQIDGESDSSELPKWGLFTLEKIDGLRILDTKFDRPREIEGYKRNSDRMKEIIIEL